MKPVHMSLSQLLGLRKLAHAPLTREQLREQRIAAGIIQSLIDKNLAEVIERGGIIYFGITELGLKQLALDTKLVGPVAANQPGCQDKKL
jgi:hypothetical protein